MPAKDPVVGDAASCDALELMLVPRVRDLGGFSVRRALPHAQRQMVGPFIFFDHFGPLQYMADTNVDVRPHPHIGLATVTYLFDGRVMHRDSEGNAREITPGAMNLMTAGRGIAHSERRPEDLKGRTGRIHGLQSWIALPRDEEEGDPSFQHFGAATLPVVEAGGVWARIVAGRAFGQASPVATHSDWLYAEVVLAAGRTAPLDATHEERAIYMIEGEIEIGGDRFTGQKLLIFRPGDAITVKAVTEARMMYLGGNAMEGPRYIWWNFVSSRRERIEDAKRDWKAGSFRTVPGETEFIPLPEA